MVHVVGPYQLAGGCGHLKIKYARPPPWLRDGYRGGAAMATAKKTYVVQDADASSRPKAPRAEFPGTLAGLINALDAARFRSAAGSPKALFIVQGKRRQLIRRFEDGREVWSASRAEIWREPKDGSAD
jgi:hypothetical protein